MRKFLATSITFIAVSSSLVSTHADAGDLCSLLFTIPAPATTLFSKPLVVVQLREALEAKLAPIEAGVLNFTSAFHERAGVGFSDTTISKLKSLENSISKKTKLVKDRELHRQRVEKIFLRDRYFRGLNQSKSFSTEFTREFVNLAMEGFAADVILIRLRLQFDTKIDMESRQIASALEKASDISHLFRNSEVYRFLRSDRSRSFFWQPLTTLEKMRSYRDQIILQMSRKHRQAFPHSALAKLETMVANHDRDIEWLHNYASFQNLEKNLRTSLGGLPEYETELARIRQKVGVSSNVTASQLNQIVNRLNNGETYEMTVIRAFEEGPHREKVLHDLNLIEEILKLSIAVGDNRAFGYYAKHLAVVHAQSVQNSEPVQPR